MEDLFGLSMSESTVMAASAEARSLLQPSVGAIGKAIQFAEVARADETGMRTPRVFPAGHVAGKLHWMHVLATTMLTRVACHEKRRRQAFDALTILPGFPGTLIHDGWKPYRELLCQHGLCNAHHLRELTYAPKEVLLGDVFEELKQPWAGRMIELLVAACHEVNEAGCPLAAARIADFRSRYADILAEGEALNPFVQKSGKRGRTRQSKPANLLLRLRAYADDVW